mmetsp:Transcript_100100/g.254563  ORF Transcript_100100/g.254563 Transcript_100100/m.254563 type:complete len:245 (+) Transcript_100100:459-1193(+)
MMWQYEASRFIVLPCFAGPPKIVGEACECGVTRLCASSMPPIIKHKTAAPTSALSVVWKLPLTLNSCTNASATLLPPSCGSASATACCSNERFGSFTYSMVLFLKGDPSCRSFASTASTAPIAGSTSTSTISAWQITLRFFLLSDIDEEAAVAKAAAAATAAVAKVEGPLDASEKHAARSLATPLARSDADRNDGFTSGGATVPDGRGNAPGNGRRAASAMEPMHSKPQKTSGGRKGGREGGLS